MISRSHMIPDIGMFRLSFLLMLRSLRGSLFGLLSRLFQLFGLLGSGLPLGLQVAFLVGRLESRDLKGNHEKNTAINKEEGDTDSLGIERASEIRRIRAARIHEGVKTRATKDTLRRPSGLPLPRGQSNSKETEP